jgi:phospholipase D1/2
MPCGRYTFCKSIWGAKTNLLNLKGVMASTKHHAEPWRAILAAGRNCWTADAAVNACGLLIDGRDYYRAFYRAACAARRYILIAGWKFSSDVRLMRGPDADEAGGEVLLLPFLQTLCQQNPDLRIYMLAWDFSVIYTLQWEWHLEQKFQTPDGRLQFRFDKQHAVGASHHQKFVVIDGHTAFLGGLDFNGDDWDDRDHRAENHERGDSGQEPHGPYHDIQACLTGPAAQELARYFQKRWQNGGNGPLDLPPAAGSLGVTLPTPIQARRVALSLNEPRTMANPREVLEISKLYEDAIAAADRLIYIENQYFTSHVVENALVRRMRDASRPPLEIVVMLPKRLPGWLQAAALEPPRLRLLESLSAVARETGHRLGFYYTAATARDGSEVPVLIHAKLLIVDDRFLTVGSTNISNRSMGVDTELNVSWEAREASERGLIDSIRRVRVSLLAEHCGLEPQDPGIRELRRSNGVVQYLDHLAGTRSGRLRPLTREAIVGDSKWLGQLERLGFSLDPDRPIIDDVL